MQNNFGNIRVQIDLRPRSLYLSHRKPPPTHKQTPPPPNLTATTVVYDWVKTNHILKNRHYVIQ